LGMHILHQEDLDGDYSWTMVAPSWRFDIAIEADLVEEIARVYGYNNLPERTPSTQQPLEHQTESKLNDRTPADQLVSRGFREVISYSFIDPATHKACFGDAPFIEVENPISADMAVMRTSLLPGLLTTVDYNLKRQRHDLALFESGLCFVPQSAPASTENLDQIKRLSGVLVGAKQPESWANTKAKVDFYDAKHEVELLIGRDLAPEVEFVATKDNPVFHPGQCAQVLKNGALIGYIGGIHPAVLKGLDIDQSVFAFELDMSALLDVSIPDFEPLSKFPEVRRDVALIVDRDIEVRALVSAAEKAAGSLLTNARIFDIYEGQGIDSNKKSVGIGLTFRDYSRTLNDEDVTTLVNKILTVLSTDFSAVQR